jgi:hypothetical protein
VGEIYIQTWKEHFCTFRFEPKVMGRVGTHMGEGFSAWGIKRAHAYGLTEILVVQCSKYSIFRSRVPRPTSRLCTPARPTNHNAHTESNQPSPSFSRLRCRRHCRLCRRRHLYRFASCPHHHALILRYNLDTGAAVSVLHQLPMDPEAGGLPGVANDRWTCLSSL